MPPQETDIMHASFGMQNTAPSSMLDDDDDEDPFAFSASFNDLSTDELDFLHQVSPTSPKTAISTDYVNERIERLRKQKGEGGTPRKATQSKIEMNISGHGDPAAKRKSISPKRSSKHSHQRSPNFDSSSEKFDVSTHFREKVAGRSAERRNRKSIEIASAGLEQPPLSRASSSKQKDPKLKRGSSAGQLAPSAPAKEPKSTEDLLEKKEKKKEKKSKKSANAERAAMKHQRSASDGAIKSGKVSSKKKKDKAAKDGSDSKEKRRRSDPVGNGGSPKSWKTAHSAQSAQSAQSAPTVTPGRTGRMSFNSQEQQTRSPKRRSAGSMGPLRNPLASPTGRLSSSSHHNLGRKTSTARRKSVSNHDPAARLSSSTHHHRTRTPTGRRRSSSNHDPAARLSASTHHHRVPSTPTGRRRSANMQDRLATPGRRRASSNHELSGRTQRDRASTPTGLRSRTPTGVRSSTPIGVRSRTPTGLRSKTPFGLRSRTPTGVRGRNPTTTTDGPFKANQDEWNELLHSSRHRGKANSPKSTPTEDRTLAEKSEKARTPTEDRTLAEKSEKASAEVSSPITPRAPRGRRSAQAPSLAAPLSAPAAGPRRTVGIRKKDQVVDVQTMLEDKSFHKDDLDSATSSHPRRSGSLKVGSNHVRGSRIGVAENAKRANASARRRNSIDHSMASFINGCTPPSGS